MSKKYQILSVLFIYKNRFHQSFDIYDTKDTINLQAASFNFKSTLKPSLLSSTVTTIFDTMYLIFHCVCITPSLPIHHKAEYLKNMPIKYNKYLNKKRTINGANDECSRKTIFTGSNNKNES